MIQVTHLSELIPLATNLTSQHLNALATVQADIEDFVDGISEAYGDRYLTLLLDINERNPYIWDAFEIPIELSIIDYAWVEVWDRGPQWVAEVSTMAGAAEAQTQLEIGVFSPEFLAIVDGNQQGVKKIVDKMKSSDLVEAASIGVTRNDIDGVKNGRKNA